EGLDLGEDGTLDHAAGDAVDAHQRCVPNRVEDGVADLLHEPSLYSRKNAKIEKSAEKGLALRPWRSLRSNVAPFRASSRRRPSSGRPAPSRKKSRSSQDGSTRAIAA